MDIDRTEVIAYIWAYCPYVIKEAVEITKYPYDSTTKASHVNPFNLHQKPAELQLCTLTQH
jgi:hypothetical protein